MVISGKVHLLFEQSGTFKRAFQKRGLHAEDYDILNDYGCTDNQVDLFAEIESAYDNNSSIFDTFTSDDLLMAFFPCIYFCEGNVLQFNGTSRNYNNKSRKEVITYIMERNHKRAHFYDLILQLFFVCESRGLRLIVENPYSTMHYLYNNFPYKPAVIDHNRRNRGDYYIKPTQYFFVNCQPTYNVSYATPPKTLTVKRLKGHKGSYCDAERSLISPAYADNFISDYILGQLMPSSTVQLSLF